MAVCEDGLAMPTLPIEARTVNTDVPDGDDADYYQYSPWRAPGSSAIFDPCGVAGGVMAGFGPFDQQYGIKYINTTNAKVGDLGTHLPRRDFGVVWQAGDVVEVSWAINANHGGGYYYRLCKLPDDGSAITEKCFQETPLRFVGQTRFRWNGDPTTDEEIDNVFVSVGTFPPGSRWAMNPVPRNDTAQTGTSFAPKCNETCTGCTTGSDPACMTCRCTGEWGVRNLEIVDNLALPWMLPAGNYVLGWRWDTEESNQVWTSCSDVTITAHPDQQKSSEATTEYGPIGKVPCPLPRGSCLFDKDKTVHQSAELQNRLRSHVAHVPLNSTLEYARQLLQQAIMVEHSTIPLYLSAYYSIVNTTGSDAASIIHSILIEEMLHMTIACNVLNAIGGAPSIDMPSFIPEFPLTLPLTNVSVDIAPLSDSLIQNFMLIEATTSRDKSIGSAYMYILSLLEALVQEYGESNIYTGNFSLQVQAQTFDNPPKVAKKISNFSDTVEALLGVSEQGGGCPVPGHEELWPREADIHSGPLGGNFSHWARFASIHAKRSWREGDNSTSGPTGPPIPGVGAVRAFVANPSVSDFEPGTQAHTLTHAFASNYTALLAKLHNVFNGAPETYFTTLMSMHALTDSAVTLMSTPDPRNITLENAVLGPTWEYMQQASQYSKRGEKARPIFHAS